ncbi:hypothetical protein Hdeb2414_s0047g00748071 [Helianthus debilis subsp. tardiflorus]
MTPEEAKQMEHFYCGNCSTEEQKLLQNAHATSRHTDTKVILCLLTIYENKDPQFFLIRSFESYNGRIYLTFELSCMFSFSIFLYWFMIITRMLTWSRDLMLEHPIRGKMFRFCDSFVKLRTYGSYLHIGFVFMYLHIDIRTVVYIYNHFLNFLIFYCCHPYVYGKFCGYYPSESEFKLVNVYNISGGDKAPSEESNLELLLQHIK